MQWSVPLLMQGDAVFVLVPAVSGRRACDEKGDVMSMSGEAESVEDVSGIVGRRCG